MCRQANPEVFAGFFLLPERMEAKICCAYNVTRGCRINSTITVADSSREPLKVLKVLVEGLARDSKSSLWLTPLQYAPQLTRIFPLDLAYLDADMKVVEAIALRPETPAPRFRAGISSALILPFKSLEKSGTVAGDLIVVCAEEELANQLAEIPPLAVGEPLKPVANAPVEETRQPFAAISNVVLHPFPIPQIASPSIAPVIPQATGFTVGATASNWRILTSTTAAVLDLAEVQDVVREEAASEPETGRAQVREVALPEKDCTAAPDTKAPSEGGEVRTSVAGSDRVSDLDPVIHPNVSASVAPRVVEEPAEVATAVADAEAITLESQLHKGKSATDGSKLAGRIADAVEQEKVQDAATAKPGESVQKAPPQKVATSTVPLAETTKRIPEEKKKESLGVLVKRFLNCEDPLPERRSIIRLLVQGLIAYRLDDDEKRVYGVRDVSPTGLYLRTQEKWRPGSVVSLVLQQKSATDEQCEKRVRVDLKAVRCDENGAGFSWVWPEGVEFEAWKRVHTKRSDETDSDYFLRELRLTRALGFLRQICPAAMEEMKLGLHKRLSNKRVASAVEIMLKAQNLLEQLRPRAKVQAHPDMVRRILENGSWTEDDWIRLWWGGLLVSSCDTKAPDTSNSTFIDLLAKLTPVHLRVLEFVCHKANERIAAGDAAPKLDLYSTSEELIEAVGSQSIARIQQTMGQLSSLALLAENSKPSYVAVTDKVKTRTTPTTLALTMYARCNGHR
jgi:hypothetical protein